MKIWCPNPKLRDSVRIAYSGSLIFITACISFLALIIDILIAIKGNIQMNAIIRTWSVTDYPGNWTEYRIQWLSLFQYRQIAILSGFVVLVIGAVFGI